MSDPRNKLKEELSNYVEETFISINGVKNFISSDLISNWKEEIKTLENIQENIKNIKIRFIDMIESEKKDEAVKQFMESINPKKAKEEKINLQKQLECSLEKFLKELKKTLLFLEGVEKLAVTSVHVFEENQVLQLTEGTDLESVQTTILTAKVICPLLISFKRDNNAFFKPVMENLEVILSQLESYTDTLTNICDTFSQCSLPDHLDLPSIELQYVSDDDVETMLSSINILHKIREDEPFRTAFLFQGKCRDFVKAFIERESRMLLFLEEVELCAVQLDKMEKGAKISSVVGSAVGLVGGALSIAGLALIPVTAGLSVALIGTGVGLGAVCGANTLVTTVTEIGVKRVQNAKANETFKKFMDDMNELHSYLNVAIVQYFRELEEKTSVNLNRMVPKVKAAVKNGEKCIAHFKALNLLEVKPAGVKAAANLPETSSPIVRKLLNMPKVARAGAIAVNALFIGMDVFFIVKDSIDLYKGCETQVSMFLRARAALWKSEICSLKRIYGLLENVNFSKQKKPHALDNLFYKTTPQINDENPEIIKVSG